MGIRRTCVVAAAGIGLPLVGVAAPAHAATTTPPLQCQGLLTCVVPIVSGLTTSVTSSVPILVNTVPQLIHTVPTVLNTVPQVLSGVLEGPPTTPKPPSKPPTPPTTTHHSKPVVAAPHRHIASTTAPAVHSPVAPTTPPTAAAPTVIPPAQTSDPNPIVQVLQQASRAVETVVNLFGWNLLALIPMAGIAFVISRRLYSARRSASGLL